MEKINEFKKELSFEERVKFRREKLGEYESEYKPILTEEKILNDFREMSKTITFDKNGNIHQFDIIDGKKVYMDESSNLKLIE